MRDMCELIKANPNPTTNLNRNPKTLTLTT